MSSQSNGSPNKRQHLNGNGRVGRPRRASLPPAKPPNLNGKGKAGRPRRASLPVAKPPAAKPPSPEQQHLGNGKFKSAAAVRLGWPEVLEPGPCEGPVVDPKPRAGRSIAAATLKRAEQRKAAIEKEEPEPAGLGFDVPAAEEEPDSADDLAVEELLRGPELRGRQARQAAREKALEVRAFEDRQRACWRDAAAAEEPAPDEQDEPADDDYAAKVAELEGHNVIDNREAAYDELMRDWEATSRYHGWPAPDPGGPEFEPGYLWTEVMGREGHRRSINVEAVPIVGLAAAYVLAYLTAHLKHGINGKPVSGCTAEGELWLYKSHAELASDLKLTDKAIRLALQKLRDHGWIKTSVKHVQARGTKGHTFFCQVSRHRIVWVNVANDLRVGRGEEPIGGAHEGRHAHDEPGTRGHVGKKKKKKKRPAK